MNFIIFIIIATSRKKSSLDTIEINAGSANDTIGNYYQSFLLSLRITYSFSDILFKIIWKSIFSNKDSMAKFRRTRNRLDG